ncbi:MAG: hypothetical protein R2737_08715 [Candidatus Nanopelagicales bacterium]
MTRAPRPVDPLVGTEAWFIRRGLPSFVRAYDSDRDVWTRTLPFLWATFGLYLLLPVLAASDVLGAVLAAGLVVALALGYVAVNLRRGRRPLARPDRVGPLVLTAYVALPALVLVPASRDWADVVVALVWSGLTLALAWVVTRLGVLPLLGWAVRWTFRQAGDLYRLATRALPLLLLVVTFLFVNTEVWQVAGSMSAAVLWASLAVFAALGVLFIAGRVPEEVRGIEASTDEAAVVRACDGTPLEGHTAGLPGLDLPVPLQRTQEANLRIVVVVSQLVQVALFAVVVWAFFVGFGALAVSVPVQQAWLGDLAPVDVLWSWGPDHGVTRELLRVATFLGGFAGFYVTVYAATDPTYRDHFFRGIGDSLARSLAVRRVYLALAGGADRRDSVPPGPH